MVFKEIQELYDTVDYIINIALTLLSIGKNVFDNSEHFDKQFETWKSGFDYLSVVNKVAFLKDVDTDDELLFGVLLDVNESLQRIGALYILMSDLYELHSYPNRDEYGKEGIIIAGILYLMDQTSPLIENMVKNQEELYSSIEEREEYLSNLKETVGLIIKATETIFDRYLALHPEEKDLGSYKEKIMCSLGLFSEGKEMKDNGYSLSLRSGNELLYLDFSTDGNTIELTEGGSVYDALYGGDSYTNWDYTLWNDGSEDGNWNLNINKAIEMINLGAQLTIDEMD